MKVKDGILKAFDRVFGGSRAIERALLFALGKYYASRLRLQWHWTEEEERPHFFEHRMGMFQFAFGDARVGPYPYNRGFFSSQIIRDKECLLDIGCGDGFMTRRFYASRCSAVDGLDIEPTAIDTARAQNGAPNVAYHRIDATSEPWPRDRYDVVIWDGALGHFEAEGTRRMLEKIARAIGDTGAFAGSESLGREGSDHLQFFESLDDLRRVLQPHFKYLALREESYPLEAGFVRREAYWRCTQDPGRVAEWNWEAGVTGRGG
jgi:SAM-dependent methyltransferase